MICQRMNVDMATKHGEKDFGEFLTDIVEHGGIAMGIGIGSQLKIFDVMVNLGPKTSTEIATAGNWKPRYIEEWLNLMVCGKVIGYVKETQQYFIPEDRQNMLVSIGKNENRSIFLQGMNVISLVSNELEQCFSLEGPNGVPYSSYKGYHEWRNERIQATFHWDGPQGLQKVLELTPDVLKKLENGAMVCDGGCGKGHHAILMAEHLPNSTFIGFDISQQCIDHAQDICLQKQLCNLTFRSEDACKMPSDWSSIFDVFTVFDVVHDVPQPMKMLKEVYRVLKPGGAFLMMDVNVHTDVENNIENQKSTIVYFFSLFHCMPVSLHAENGEGLGTAWGIEAQEKYLTDAGFRDINMLVTEDKFHSYFVAYK